MPWMFCAFAASRKPRRALTGSAAPVCAPIGAGALDGIVFTDDDRHAPARLNITNPTITFFIQRSPDP